MALWVDREHGEEGELFIAERVLHFEAEGDEGGKQLWIGVARRHLRLANEETAGTN